MATTARNRTRNQGPKLLPQRKYTNGNPGLERLGTVFQVDEEMDDYVVDNFGKRMHSGDIINNPCSYVKSSVQCTTGGSSYILQGGNVYEIYGEGSLTEFQRFDKGAPWALGRYPKPTPPDYFEDSVKLQALGNLDRSPYSFAEDIAELHETLRFLRDPLGSLRKLSKSLDKDASDLVSKYKHLDRAKAVADVWLQYRFAFSPLVRSGQDLIESFTDKIHRPPRRTARGKAVWEQTNSGLGTSRTYYEWEGSAQVEQEHKAGILYEVSNPLNDWKFKYGLRFKDIPETLWAVLPYSFMVDRVWNISQAVRGVTSFLDPNVKILAGWYSVKDTTRYTLSYIDYTYPSASTVSIVPDVRTEEIGSYTRATWSPTMSDAVPPMRLDQLVDSSTKLADLASLILQNVRLR